MRDIWRDDRWLRQSVALLELSASVLSATPTPSRRAVRSFAEVARGLAERSPGWLRPWPVLILDAGDDEQPLVAVALARVGPRLLVREVKPAAGTLTVTVVLEYYLHLVDDHLVLHDVDHRGRGAAADGGPDTPPTTRPTTTTPPTTRPTTTTSTSTTTTSTTTTTTTTTTTEPSAGDAP